MCLSTRNGVTMDNIQRKIFTVQQKNKLTGECWAIVFTTVPDTWLFSLETEGEGEGEWRSAWGERDMVLSHSWTSGVTTSGGAGAGARTGVDLTMCGTTSPVVGGSSFLTGWVLFVTSFCGLVVMSSFLMRGGEVLIAGGTWNELRVSRQGDSRLVVGVVRMGKIKITVTHWDRSVTMMIHNTVMVNGFVCLC